MDPIKQAAQLIKDGQAIIMPTETVYAVAADGMNPEAVKKIYAVKQRPAQNPLILHIATLKQLNEIAVNVPEAAYKLMKAFWPGPLTFVLPKHPNVPAETCAGMDSVAVRMPNHPMALELIKLSNTAIAGPSANTSGKPSATRFEDLEPDLLKSVSFTLNGGDCTFGIESTIVDLRSGEINILRPGLITMEDMLKVLGSDQIEYTGNSAFHAPGSRYRHYSPNTKIELTPYSENELAQVIEATNKHLLSGKKVGVMITKEYAHRIPKEAKTYVLGESANLQTVATNLFKTLNQVDNDNLDIIVSQSFPEQGIGIAIMDRLTKAATS